MMHSSFSPAESLEALRASINEERWSFSLSVYAGDLPVLGKFSDRGFRLRKRIYYNNAGARMLYGKFLPESGGTHVEAHLDSPLLTKVFTCFWMGAVALICLGVLIVHGGELFSGDRGSINLSLLISFGILGAGLILMQGVRLLSRSGERFLVEHLQETLNAQVK